MNELRPGRHVVVPSKDQPLRGGSHNARSLLRERRRRIVTFLLEGIAFSLIIGAVEPLRGFWILGGGLILLLAVYVFALARIRRLAEIDRRAAGAAKADETGVVLLPDTVPGTDVAVIRAPGSSAEETGAVRLIRSGHR